MAKFELFGFQFGKTKTREEDKAKAASFVYPDDHDGAITIETSGAHFGQYTVDFDGQLRNDIELINKYREMSLHPECEMAVDDIQNEAIVHDETDGPVDISLDEVEQPATIKKKIEEEFQTILKLLKFKTKGSELFRRWYIDGKLYHHIIPHENKKKGIQEVRPIDPIQIRKVRQVQKETDQKTGKEVVTGFHDFYVYNDKGAKHYQEHVGLKVSPDAISYVTSGLYDASGQRIISHLHKAIKPLNQLRMLEDAVVIYRLSRAPERRIFYIDVGSLPKTKAEQYLRDIMNRYRNKLVYDADTGEIRDDKKFMSMLEDFWLPRREGGRGTEISTLDGGQTLGEIEDVNYFQKRLYKALNVPTSRLEADNGFNMGRASEITRDELKFSKFIFKLRARFADLFLNLLKTQLVLKGIMKVEEWDRIAEDIRFDFTSDSHFTELKNAELLEDRMNLLSSAESYVGEYFSKEWVQKNILQMDDKDIKEIESQITKEKASGDVVSDDDEAFGQEYANSY